MCVLYMYSKANISSKYALLYQCVTFALYVCVCVRYDTHES